MPDAEKPYSLLTEDEKRERARARSEEYERWRKQELDNAILAISAHPGGDGLDLADPDAVVAFLEPLDEKTRRGLFDAINMAHGVRPDRHDRKFHPLYGTSDWWVAMWAISLGAGAPSSVPRWSLVLGKDCRTAPESWEVLLRALRLRPPGVRTAFARSILGNGYLELGRAALVDAAVNAELLPAPDSVRFRAGAVLGAATFWDKDWWWATPSTRASDVLAALRDPEVAATLKVTKSRVFDVTGLVKSGRLPRQGLAESCLTVLSQSLEPNAATLPRNALEALGLAEDEIAELAGAITRMISHGDPQSASLGVSWVRAFPAAFRVQRGALRTALAAVARSGTKGGAEEALACAAETLEGDDQARVLIAALEHRNDALARRALAALARADRAGWPSELGDELAEAIAGLPASLREDARGLVPSESRVGGETPARVAAAAPEFTGHPYPRTRVTAFTSPSEMADGVKGYCGDPTDPILAARILDGLSRWTVADLGAECRMGLQEVLEAREKERSGIHAFDGDGEFAWMLARWLRCAEAFRSIDELADGLSSFLDGPSDSRQRAMVYDGIQRWDAADLEATRGAELRARSARAVADRLEGGDREWMECAQSVHRWLNEPSFPCGLKSKPRAGAPRRGGIAAVAREPLVDLACGPPVDFPFLALRDGRLDELYVLGWASRRPSLDLPSWSTGHIDPIDLLDRLEALEGGEAFSVGEFELWHALLRLDLALVDSRCLARVGALTSEAGGVVGAVMSGSASSPLASQVLRVRETHIDGLSVVTTDALPPWPYPQVQTYRVHVTRVHGQHPTGKPWIVGFASKWRSKAVDSALAECERIVDTTYMPSIALLDWTAVTIPSQRGLLAVAPLVAGHGGRSDEGRVREQVGALNAFLRSGQVWGPLEAHFLAHVLSAALSPLLAAPVADILPTLAAAGVPARLVGTRVAALANDGDPGIDRAGQRFATIASDPAVAAWVVEWCCGVVDSLEGTPAGVLEVLRAWEAAAAVTGSVALSQEGTATLERLATGGSQRAVVAKRILARATP